MTTGWVEKVVPKENELSVEVTEMKVQTLDAAVDHFRHQLQQLESLL